MSDGVSNEGGRALRLGVAGPVGTGKSSLIATVCRNLAAELSIAVITNDIYTDKDARFLRSAGVLPEERIRAVETGACPHTAIRDHITMNLMAVDKIDLAAYVEVDGDQMIADATKARSGGPVPALTRKRQETVDQLCAWIRWLRAEHLAGRHVATDPGPMAPHFHAVGGGEELFHRHEH
jgi:urease accessory protein